MTAAPPPGSRGQTRTATCRGSNPSSGTMRYRPSRGAATRKSGLLTTAAVTGNGPERKIHSMSAHRDLTTTSRPTIFGASRMKLTSRPQHRQGQVQPFRCSEGAYDDARTRCPGTPNQGGHPAPQNAPPWHLPSPPRRHAAPPPRLASTSAPYTWGSPRVGPPHYPRLPAPEPKIPGPAWKGLLNQDPHFASYP